VIAPVPVDFTGQQDLLKRASAPTAPKAGQLLTMRLLQQWQLPDVRYPKQFLCEAGGSLSER